jgi:hypothetical protein
MALRDNSIISINLLNVMSLELGTTWGGIMAMALVVNGLNRER